MALDQASVALEDFGVTDAFVWVLSGPARRADTKVRRTTKACRRGLPSRPSCTSQPSRPESKRDAGKHVKHKELCLVPELNNGNRQSSRGLINVIAVIRCRSASVRAACVRCQRSSSLRSIRDLRKDSAVATSWRRWIKLKPFWNIHKPLPRFEARVGAVAVKNSKERLRVEQGRYYIGF